MMFTLVVAGASTVACSALLAPTPNIDATVEARVRSVRLPPTYTPYPTYTPAPTPSPQVVLKEVIVEVTPTPEPTVQAVVESYGIRLLEWSWSWDDVGLQDVIAVVENTNDQALYVQIIFNSYDKSGYFLEELHVSSDRIPARTKSRFTKKTWTEFARIELISLKSSDDGRFWAQ